MKAAFITPPVLDLGHKPLGQGVDGQDSGNRAPKYAELKMINNIQVLRAFAAINVVLFHVIETSASYSQRVGFLRYLEGWGLMA